MVKGGGGGAWSGGPWKPMRMATFERGLPCWSETSSAIQSGTDMFATVSGLIVDFLVEEES